MGIVGDVQCAGLCLPRTIWVVATSWLALCMSAHARPDHVVKLEDVERSEAEYFDSMDRDGDGMLTPAELMSLYSEQARSMEGLQAQASAAGPHAVPIVPGVSADSASAIDGLTAPAESRFRQLDADGDGVLSLDEFRNTTKITISRATMGTLTGLASGAVQVINTPTRDPDEMNALVQHGVQQFFQRLDTNGDGVIMRDEMPTATSRMRALDVDQDGGLTLEELSAGDSASTSAVLINPALRQH